MHENHLYDLLEQITIEQKSLWRIKRDYLRDSEGYPECQEFWKKMEKDKEDHVKELTGLIKKHL